MCVTLTLSQTVAYVSKSSYAAAAANMLPLTGRYEVVIPNRNGIIFFTDSLHAAARHVALARWGNADKTGEVLAYLEGVEKYGSLAPGQYGVRVHRPFDDNNPWTAKVRGTQLRPAHKYNIGDAVETTDEYGELPPHLKPGRQLRITGVVVLNDIRAGRQYGYLVGAGAGQRVPENRLRPVTAGTGELDFDGLGA